MQKSLKLLQSIYGCKYHDEMIFEHFMFFSCRSNCSGKI